VSLGVIVSKDLKPTSHIKQMVAKAHQRSNAISSSFVSRDIDLLPFYWFVLSAYMCYLC